MHESSPDFNCPKSLIPTVLLYKYCGVSTQHDHFQHSSPFSPSFSLFFCPVFHCFHPPSLTFNHTPLIPFILNMLFPHSMLECTQLSELAVEATSPQQTRSFQLFGIPHFLFVFFVSSQFPFPISLFILFCFWSFFSFVPLQHCEHTL